MITGKSTPEHATATMSFIRNEGAKKSLSFFSFSGLLANHRQRHRHVSDQFKVGGLKKAITGDGNRDTCSHAD